MKIFEDFDLTDYNSYKIKAKCKRALFPETEQDIIEYYSGTNDPYLLGTGHNIILSKDYYDRDFVIFHGNFDKITIVDDLVEVEAGAFMWDISKAALTAGLSGVEVFYDIPSSLGGAVVMNAGAGGEEVKDVLVKVRYFDLEDFTVKEILKEDMSFEYRNSFFQRNTNKIVLKAWLRLKKADKTDIAIKMEGVKASRWAKQPKAFPNAGSVFKRPPGYYVGVLMDELNLKGYTVGGAKISEKHGGFIVNFNGATGQDILDIITHVKNSVMEKYSVDLEVEQRII